MLSYFLLVGQSNMAGRGVLTTQDNSVFRSDGVYIYQHDAYLWQPAKDPLQDPNDPVFSVKADRIGGVGPGLSFADTMSNVLSEEVGLLLCAQGGSGIAAWGGDQMLYRETIRRARVASQSAILKGVCIYVGESDAGSETMASLWSIRFKELCFNLRRDLGINLPIVFAQLATVSDSRRARKEHGYVGWDALKSHQKNISLENCLMIKTDDLSLNDDGIHLSATAQRICGRRFANSMIRLLESC